MGHDPNKEPPFFFMKPSTAIVTDELVGTREMVVKGVGPQIAAIRGISGATILGDGRIVVILDVGSTTINAFPSALEPGIAMFVVLRATTPPTE
mgnify:CR=1 FL=1